MNNVDRDINDLIKILESLKEEHFVILSINKEEIELENEIDANLIRKDLPRIQNSSERVLLGIEDAKLLKLLSEYIKIVDADRKNQSINFKKLRDESNWLRDEVSYLQTNLRKSDEKIVELEEENKRLNFLLELKAISENSLEKEDNSEKQIPIRFDSFMSNYDGNDKYANCEDENKESPNSENVVNTSSAPGFELPPRLKTLHNLVIQYASQGRYEVAIPLCKQTLEDLEKTSGRNHPDVATMLNILALVYRDQNKFTDAVNLLKEALSIREATLGPVHVAVAANLNNLAVLYGKQRKYNEAEPLCKRSLIIREQLLGSDHPDVAKQLNNLALLCQNQGKYSEVEEYYFKAIKIYTDAYGKNCADVNKTKNNLAAAYMKQGKYREAELMYKEIINHEHEGMCGDIAPNNKTIWMLAEEREYGRDRSSSNREDEKDSWAKIYSKNWSQCYTTLKNLASLYRRQNKIEAADVIDTLANKNISKQEQSLPNGYELSVEKSSIFVTPISSNVTPRNRPSSVCMSQEVVTKVNAIKSKPVIRTNNISKSFGPVKASRASLADNFTSKFTKNSVTGNGSLQMSFGDSWQSSGDGKLKKASSMSQLPGPTQSTNTQNLKQPGLSWLSQGRTSSIENIKKAFGKRP